MHYSTFATALLAMSVATCYGQLHARYPLFDNVSVEVEIGNGNGNNNGNGNGVANNKPGTGPVVLQPIVQTIPDRRTLVTSPILATKSTPVIAFAAMATPATPTTIKAVATPNIPVAKAIPNSGQAASGKANRRRSGRLIARNPALENVGVKLKIGNGNGLNNGNGNGVGNGWPTNVAPIPVPTAGAPAIRSVPTALAMDGLPPNDEPTSSKESAKEVPGSHPSDASSESGTQHIKKRYHGRYGRDCAWSGFLFFHFRMCI
ncbi:hypothetical protein TWF694_005286 [Orbilia ellipsospora]|uniref:Uncharacterized protein n=1 Tax=Orbilia ellipsospora TaxID=2528407 RepID=A0AAV9WU87_9PEZI